LNGAAATLLTASLISRVAGNRAAGRSTAWLGFGLSTAASYIGGHLVFGEQIGVNHAAGQSAPDDFTAALADAELPAEQPRLAEVAGTRVVLVRHRGKIHALAEICSHLGGPLSEGRLHDGSIVCPWHSSRFALEG